ncbi:hypothetical protein [Pseudosulfitobacter pseudonitzschiae]|uniref:hypothetical protein n=1 Tax=Pseudosulfitobacter pseudonitzschiae TaxID=1402135 RepID=UPI001AF49EF6|nr:hypothetical protein [Pseudosulfitobacter pseudonitzschiae]MBM1817200.1 hypothetical protein [Pseudosulfitobacter pseudonitzschiae]MBM1834211.1 hypothetical protein [Pseudosulfitobacter pseudonitzschiae]MBM1839076.1 hypothetical protein [Pseudosulfitobacter pseudonitzschiae]MBM1843924.1 hypothetical protein [Pseudosulfitobacter pseudonitzschiae]MBM1848761.1 hypothetical protein [Pseudosulfitobacter pseudonitzschiae]
MTQPRTADAKALEFVRKCEADGHVVRRLIIDGKRIEVEFDDKTVAASLDNVKW